VPVAASNTTVSSKQTKMSNFERLIGRMQEEFPDVSRSGLVDVYLEILTWKSFLCPRHSKMGYNPLIFDGVMDLYKNKHI